jgi:hypothetical protein
MTHRLPDYSPEGHHARTELARQTLHQVSAIAPVDRRERLAAAVLTEWLTLDEGVSPGLEGTGGRCRGHRAAGTVAAVPLQRRRESLECCAWGLAELERATAQTRALVRRISSGATPGEVAAQLDANPRRHVPRKEP